MYRTSAKAVANISSPDLEAQAYQCVSNTCNKDVMGNNMYQTQYIIQVGWSLLHQYFCLMEQMRYATGSIYEDPNMGQWGQGIPPWKSDPPVMPLDGTPVDQSSSSDTYLTASTLPGSSSLATSTGVNRQTREPPLPSSTTTGSGEQQESSATYTTAPFWCIVLTSLAGVTVF